MENQQQNQTQKQLVLQQLRNIQQQIEVLKDNQISTSQNLINDLHKVNQKIDVIESLMNSLSPHQIQSQIESHQQRTNTFNRPKSSQVFKTNRPIINELPLNQEQKNQFFSFNNLKQKLQSDQIIQAHQNPIEVNRNFSKQNISQQKNNNVGIKIFSQQNSQQIMKVQQNKCISCQSENIGLIRTPCFHFFHQICLQKLYEQQLMDYHKTQAFYCICKHKLLSSVFLKNLNIDKETLFKKQVHIFQLKYKDLLQQCKRCQLIFIFNIYQKTTEYCFQCGDQLKG